jgi:hypothetical protein
VRTRERMSNVEFMCSNSSSTSFVQKREREGERERTRESKNESEADPRRTARGKGGRARPSSTAYSARQSRLPVPSSTSGVSELTPILIVAVEARSSHCLRVRLSLGGCAARTGGGRKEAHGRSL